MRRKASSMPTAEYIERIESNDAESIVNDLVREAAANSVCLTCSFQAEDMVVLDLLRAHLPQVPVIFLETGYHFAANNHQREKTSRRSNTIACRAARVCSR